MFLQSKFIPLSFRREIEGEVERVGESISVILAVLAGLSRDRGVITEGSVSEAATDPRQTGRSLKTVELVVSVDIAFKWEIWRCKS